MLEVKELLIDLEAMGASIKLKDGAPRLHGKVDADTMQRIKTLKSQIVEYLSDAAPETPRATLFVEPTKMAPSALDVTGRKESVKVKKKLDTSNAKPFDMVAGQCACCAEPMMGHLARSDFQWEGTIYERSGMYYCLKCESLLALIDAGEQAKLDLVSRVGFTTTACVVYKALDCDKCCGGEIRQQVGWETDGSAKIKVNQCMECDGKGRMPCQ